jgi:zona occludens toxin (predicted ATPase)
MARKNKKIKKAKKINQKNYLLIFFILFFLVLILSLYNLFNYLSVLEKREIHTEVIVSDKVGIAINESALLFGMVMPGASSRKNITIINDYEQDIKVDIVSKGNIKNFLFASENSFIMDKGELKEIKFFVKIPKDTNYGKYEGKIIFVIKRRFF